MAVYGIDLGTTYSCIAKLDVNGNPQVISNITDASDTLASAIYFETLDNIIIGQSAKEYVETDGENVVQFIKREIGKEEKYGPHFIHGKEFTPVELSALILKRVKEMAEEQGEEVNDVIITCPAYFGFKERDLTKKAGEIAGLNVLNLINEPTAAALNYCSRLFQEETNILVYDLGGGTFDVTLVHMSVIPNSDGKDERQIKIIATGGNDALGGKDWDDKLFEKIRNQICDELGLSASELDIETIQNIRSKVEVTKKKLTQAEKAVVKVSIEGQIVKINVTREEFEELTKSLVDQTMSYVEGTLEKAKKVVGEEPKIDTVLLVGGSTNMPMIKRVVEERFPGLVQVEDPDRAVAKGAAIYADMIVSEISEDSSEGIDISTNHHEDGDRNINRGTIQTPLDIIVDVAPRSFGPAIYFDNDYLIDNLVKEGQEINKTIEKQYVTMVDNQKMIVFPVYESHSLEDTEKPCFIPDLQTGEDVPQDTDPSLEVKKLGELVLNLNGNDPKGTVVYVEFTVQPVGIIIKVTLSTDLSVTKEEVIHYDNGISQEEMEQMAKNINRVSITGE